MYQYIKEWRRNPHWSFSCCLALLLPLNDLQGEIRGMVGKNVLKTQLQTGAIGKPSISACAKDSGAMSVTLTCRKGTLGDDNRTQLMQPNYKVAKYSITKCDEGTQTGITMLPAAVIVVQHLMEGGLQKSL